MKTPYHDSFEVDEPVECEPEAIDQDAERPWILDDGSVECYEIVARPSYIKEALYTAKSNLGWTSFIDSDGDLIFINVHKLIAIAPPSEK